MKKYRNLTNQKFGRLTAIKMIKRENHKTYWLFKCECGNEIVIPFTYVTTGDCKSCGCYRKEKCKDNAKRTHNMSKTRMYRIWTHMKKRCYDVNAQAYMNYGDRGIKVCNEWKNNFINFYNWAINNGYREDLSIDRIDVNGNYEPSNCRWATIKEQNNNMRRNHWIYYNDEKLTMKQFSEKYNIPYDLVKNRIRYKWSIERIINTPLKVYAK